MYRLIKKYADVVEMKINMYYCFWIKPKVEMITFKNIYVNHII